MIEVMKDRKFLLLVVPLGLALCSTVPAQEQALERGQWRASSTTAKGVTGDLAFTETKIIMNFTGFTIAQIRTLQPMEAKAVFDGLEPAEGEGNLYRTDIAGTKRFLHKNTLCGSEDVQWIATFVHGRTLEMAMFSGAAMPTMTATALASSTTLCGTYSYQR